MILSLVNGISIKLCHLLVLIVFEISINHSTDWGFCRCFVDVLHDRLLEYYEHTKCPQVLVFMEKLDSKDTFHYSSVPHRYNHSIYPGTLSILVTLSHLKCKAALFGFCRLSLSLLRRAFGMLKLPVKLNQAKGTNQRALWMAAWPPCHQFN